MLKRYFILFILEVFLVCNLHISGAFANIEQIHSTKTEAGQNLAVSSTFHNTQESNQIVNSLKDGNVPSASSSVQEQENKKKSEEKDKKVTEEEIDQIEKTKIPNNYKALFWNMFLKFGLGITAGAGLFCLIFFAVNLAWWICAIIAVIPVCAGIFFAGEKGVSEYFKKKQNKKIEQVIDGQAEKLKGAEKKIENLNDDMGKQRLTNKDLKEKIANTDNKLKDAEGQITELNQDLEAQQERMDKTEKELEEIKKAQDIAVGDLENKIVSMQEKMKSFASTKDMSDLKQQIKDFKESYKEENFTEKFIDLSKKIKKLEEGREDNKKIIKQELEKSKIELDSLIKQKVGNAKIDFLQEEIDKVKGELVDKANAEISKLKKELEAILTTKIEIELNAGLEKITQDIKTKMTSGLEVFNKKLTVGLEGIKINKDEIEKLTTGIKGYEERINELEKERKALDEKEEKNNVELEKINKRLVDVEKYKGAIEKIKGKEEKVDELEQLRKTLSKMEKDINNLQLAKTCYDTKIKGLELEQTKILSQKEEYKSLTLDTLFVTKKEFERVSFAKELLIEANKEYVNDMFKQLRKNYETRLKELQENQKKEIKEQLDQEKLNKYKRKQSQSISKRKKLMKGDIKRSLSDENISTPERIAQAKGRKFFKRLKRTQSEKIINRISEYLKKSDKRVGNLSPSPKKTVNRNLNFDIKKEAEDFSKKIEANKQKEKDQKFIEYERLDIELKKINYKEQYEKLLKIIEDLECKQDAFSNEIKKEEKSKVKQEIEKRNNQLKELNNSLFGKKEEEIDAKSNNEKDISELMESFSEKLEQKYKAPQKKLNKMEKLVLEGKQEEAGNLKKEIQANKKDNLLDEEDCSNNSGISFKLSGTLSEVQESIKDLNKKLDTKIEYVKDDVTLRVKDEAKSVFLSLLNLLDEHGYEDENKIKNLKYLIDNSESLQKLLEENKKDISIDIKGFNKLKEHVESLSKDIKKNVNLKKSIQENKAEFIKIKSIEQEIKKLKENLKKREDANKKLLNITIEKTENLEKRFKDSEEQKTENEKNEIQVLKKQEEERLNQQSIVEGLQEQIEKLEKLYIKFELKEKKEGKIIEKQMIDLKNQFLKENKKDEIVEESDKSQKGLEKENGVKKQGAGSKSNMDVIFKGIEQWFAYLGEKIKKQHKEIEEKVKKQEEELNNQKIGIAEKMELIDEILKGEDFKKIKNQILELSNKIEGLKIKEQLENNIKQVNNVRTGLQEQFDNKIKELNTAKDKLDIATETLVEKLEEQNSLSLKIQEQVRAIDDKKTKQDELITKLNKNVSTIESQLIQIETIRNEIGKNIENAAEQEKKGYEDKINELDKYKEEIQELKQQLEEKNKKQDEKLEDETTCLDKIKQEVKTKGDNLEKRIGTIETKNKKFTDNINDTINNTNKELGKIVSNNKTLLENLVNKDNGLIVTLKKNYTQQIKKIQNQVSLFIEQQNQNNQENKISNIKIQEIKDDLNNAFDQKITNMQTVIDEKTKKQIKDLDTKIVTANQAVDTVKTELNDKIDSFTLTQQAQFDTTKKDLKEGLQKDFSSKLDGLDEKITVIEKGLKQEKQKKNDSLKVITDNITKIESQQVEIEKKLIKRIEEQDKTLQETFLNTINDFKDEVNTQLKIFVKILPNTMQDLILDNKDIKDKINQLVSEKVQNTKKEIENKYKEEIGSVKTGYTQWKETIEGAIKEFNKKAKETLGKMEEDYETEYKNFVQLKNDVNAKLEDINSAKQNFVFWETKIDNKLEEVDNEYQVSLQINQKKRDTLIKNFNDRIRRYQNSFKQIQLKFKEKIEQLNNIKNENRMSMPYLKTSSKDHLSNRYKDNINNLQQKKPYLSTNVKSKLNVKSLDFDQEDTKLKHQDTQSLKPGELQYNQKRREIIAPTYIKLYLEEKITIGEEKKPLSKALQELGVKEILGYNGKHNIEAGIYQIKNTWVKKQNGKNKQVALNIYGMISCQNQHYYRHKNLFKCLSKNIINKLNKIGFSSNRMYILKKAKEFGRLSIKTEVHLATLYDKTEIDGKVNIKLMLEQNLLDKLLNEEIGDEQKNKILQKLYDHIYKRYCEFYPEIQKKFNGNDQISIIEQKLSDLLDFVYEQNQKLEQSVNNMLSQDTKEIGTQIKSYLNNIGIHIINIGNKIKLYYNKKGELNLDLDYESVRMALEKSKQLRNIQVLIDIALQNFIKEKIYFRVDNKKRGTFGKVQEPDENKVKIGKNFPQYISIIKNLFSLKKNKSKIQALNQNAQKFLKTHIITVKRMLEEQDKIDSDKIEIKEDAIKKFLANRKMKIQDIKNFKEKLKNDKEGNRLERKSFINVINTIAEIEFDQYQGKEAMSNSQNNIYKIQNNIKKLVSPLVTAIKQDYVSEAELKGINGLTIEGINLVQKAIKEIVSMSNIVALEEESEEAKKNLTDEAMAIFRIMRCA